MCELEEDLPQRAELHSGLWLSKSEVQVEFQFFQVSNLVSGHHFRHGLIKLIRESQMQWFKKTSVFSLLFFSMFRLWATDDGLDLVVLVDQSGSMTGTGSKAKNDPEGVRNDIVRLTLETLVMNGTNNNVTNKLGVISFGTTVRVDLPLTEVNEQNSQALQSRLNSSLTVDSLGNTDFLAALNKAKQIFGNIPDKPNGNRKKVIILVTDGAPYVKDIKVPQYKQEMRDLLNNDFLDADYHFQVFGLNDEESDYWARYGQLWRDLTDNHATKLTKSDEHYIFKIINNAINDLLATSSGQVTNFKNHFVPPYLETIAFNIFSVEPESGIELFSPSAPDTPLSSRDPNVQFSEVGKTISTFTIKRPEPGSWRIKKSNEKSRVDVYTQRFFTRGELISPKNGEPIKQHQETPILYRVINSEGSPIEELDGYPISLVLAIYRPGEGVPSSKIRMKKNEALGKGVYESERKFLCDTPGRYQTEVTISTVDPNYKPIVIFRDRYSGFHVNGATLIQGTIKYPKPNEGYSLWRNVVFMPAEIPLEIEFKEDRQDQPVNLEALFKRKISEIIQTSLSHSDNPTDAEILLENTKNGVVTGVIRGLKKPGTYRLHLAGSETLQSPNHSIRFLPTDVTVRVRLQAIHWAQLLSGAAIILLMLVLLAIWFLNNYRFPLRGRLWIERMGDGKSWSLPLRSNRHQMKFKEAELPNQTTLVKVEVKAKKDKRGGILVTALGPKKKMLLDNRQLVDGGTAMISSIPYIFKYKK